MLKRDQASFVKYLFSRMYALASLPSQLKRRWRAAIGERLNSRVLYYSFTTYTFRTRRRRAPRTSRRVSSQQQVGAGKRVAGRRVPARL